MRNSKDTLIKNSFCISIITFCFFLAACANNTADQGREETLSEVYETEVTTEIAEETIKESVDVPTMPPVKDLNDFFERDSVEEVMLVVDRRLLDDITVMANDEEKKSVLDELYEADLSQFEDAGQEKPGGMVEKYKFRTAETEISLSVYQDMTGTLQYLQIRDESRLPLAVVKGPAGTFDFGRLGDLSAKIRTNIEDPNYSGIVSIPETGYKTEMNKLACGYAIYFFETSLETDLPDAINKEETIPFDVLMEIGKTVYRLQSDTGSFAKEDANGTVYGQLDEEALFTVIHEAHIGSQLNEP